jgi:hypothetical protein
MHRCGKVKGKCLNKNAAALPSNFYSPERPGAIYFVPCHQHITKERYDRKHKSYYNMTLKGGLKATGTTSHQQGIMVVWGCKNFLAMLPRFYLSI